MVQSILKEATLRLPTVFCASMALNNAVYKDLTIVHRVSILRWKGPFAAMYLFF